MIVLLVVVLGFWLLRTVRRVVAEAYRNTELVFGSLAFPEEAETETP